MASVDTMFSKNKQGDYWTTSFRSRQPKMFSKAALKGLLIKRFSKNMQQIYWRTPMPKSDFNKVALQLYRNHTSA